MHISRFYGISYVMKILITIPHYYYPSKESYGSSDSSPQVRIEAFKSCLFNIYSLFSPSQCMIDIQNKKTIKANSALAHSIDVVVCTANDRHLLSQANIPGNFYTNHAVTLEDPKYLGFECQRVLKENLGKYDYYCFMEDDLIINDPYFFEKIKWFNSFTDKMSVLQPNRYEVSTCGSVLKSYVDGDIRPAITEKYQNVNEFSELSKEFLEQNILFHRPYNTHSASYFLTQEQMQYWVDQPYFLDLDASFITPLESSASLGVMKTFRVYKPSPENANFLEIQHHGDRFLRLIGNRVALTD